MTLSKSKRRTFEARAIVRSLRAIAAFEPGTYGLLPNDTLHVQAVRILEKRGLVRTRWESQVIMVDLTDKGCRWSGKRTA